MLIGVRTSVTTSNIVLYLIKKHESPINPYLVSRFYRLSTSVGNQVNVFILKQGADEELDHIFKLLHNDNDNDKGHRRTRL